MNEKEKAVVEAAIRVIQRYGVRRTTMCDISDEAGISRQTLYSLFPCKEEVLRATIRLYTAQTLEEIHKGCTSAKSLDESLDSLFECLARRPREMMDASPDAADIFVGFNEAAREELETACCDFQAAIAEVLGPHESQILASGLSVYQLSDYVQNATNCIKKEAKSAEHLKDMLAVLKVLILSVSQQRGAA